MIGPTPDLDSPTSTPYPGQALQEPPQISEEEVLEEVFQDRVADPPSDEMTTYVDENLGFSFIYPASWRLDEPGKMAVDLSRGYSVELTNYDPSRFVLRKDGAFPLNEIKLGLHVYFYDDEFNMNSVEKWLRSNFHPETKFTFVEEKNRDGYGEYRWIVEEGMLDHQATVTVLLKDDKAYLIIYSPADTQYAQTMEEVVRSVRLP